MLTTHSSHWYWSSCRKRDSTGLHEQNCQAGRILHMHNTLFYCFWSQHRSQKGQSFPVSNRVWPESPGGASFPIPRASQLWGVLEIIPKGRMSLWSDDYSAIPELWWIWATGRGEPEIWLQPLLACKESKCWSAEAESVGRGWLWGKSFWEMWSSKTANYISLLQDFFAFTIIIVSIMNQ